MELTHREPQYMIPSYSLTGDLLSFKKCGLQYRYNNRGNLPPSKPVQLWIGEFLHDVLEEAFRGWKEERLPAQFPWDWSQNIRPLELRVAERLLARGLPPNTNVFCPEGVGDRQCSCGADAPHDGHMKLASRRADALINTWASHLFPLITDAEHPLHGIRPMPATGKDRADHYEITGVADVIGSLHLMECGNENLVVQKLLANPVCRESVDSLGESAYEVIVDYKGTRRPNLSQDEWLQYQWQLQTYAWLRSLQSDASPVLAGILLFANELVPSRGDLSALKKAVEEDDTDVVPIGGDREQLAGFTGSLCSIDGLTVPFLQDRSVLVVPLQNSAILDSLERFDSVVSDIESAVREEMRGTRISTAWSNPQLACQFAAPLRRICTACDAKYHCSLAETHGLREVPRSP